MQSKLAAAALILATWMAGSASQAASVVDGPAAVVAKALDRFNGGDLAAFFAAHDAGSVTIVDEFAPHLWSGPSSAQAWAADYDTHAKATGVSDAHMAYKPATRVEANAEDAYVVVPTVYIYKEKGASTAEESEMTFALHKGAAGWKIRAWTFSGVKPHPAK